MIDLLLNFKVILAICVIATLTFIFTLKKKKMSKEFSKFLLVTYLNFMIFLGVSFYLKGFEKVNYLFMGLWLSFGILTLIISKILKVYNYKIGSIFTIFMISIVQIGYILNSPYYVRQHDNRSFTEYEYGGHLGYIGYIFFNNKLPVGSPKDTWCFFNPPLFYLISAFIMKVQTHFGLSIENSLENLQISTLIYVTIFNIYVYRILKEIGVKKILPYILSFVRIASNYDYFKWKLGKWNFIANVINNGDFLHN